jgi:ATP-dependent Clp protease ATP-binding subunit ClpA
VANFVELNPDTSLVKINFGNYSSQDALNSLIGSPRGYRGSEEGELSIKLGKRGLE